MEKEGGRTVLVLMNKEGRGTVPVLMEKQRYSESIPTHDRAEFRVLVF